MFQAFNIDYNNVKKNHVGIFYYKTVCLSGKIHTIEASLN